jgi:hypothetical protein
MAWQAWQASGAPRAFRAEACSEVAQAVARDTAAHLSDARYITSEALHEWSCAAVGALVRASPREQLLLQRMGELYLWGSAGVGKSTFVQLFASGLQSALRKHVQPQAQVNVVKVPLNSVSAEHLSHILRIQGISDWSVERMVEQSIAKDNIALLHLEWRRRRRARTSAACCAVSLTACSSASLCATATSARTCSSSRHDEQLRGGQRRGRERQRQQRKQRKQRQQRRAGPAPARALGAGPAHLGAGHA